MKPTTPDAAKQPNELSSRQTARLETQPQQNLSNRGAQIQELIRALGEPSHPVHSQAVDKLVEIGAPAVPALSAALAPTYPWLTSFRAAEALARIGDGRASGALINALRHPNSNVRWSAIRALAEVGDSRTLLALRRVAREDRSKTSWGESVADTAQLALDRLQSESALLRFSEPIKTAVLFVIMAAVLVFAVDRVQALRDELQRIGSPAAVVFGDTGETAATGTTDAGGAGAPGAEAAATSTPKPTPKPTSEPTSAPATPTPGAVPGTARVNGNVRAAPSLNSDIIGGVSPGDELIFLERQGEWYRVQLGGTHAPTSSIQGGEGWAHAIVVNAPPGVQEASQ
jgi:hypothetical protein